MNRMVLIVLGLIGAMVAPWSASADWQKGCQTGAAYLTNSLGTGGNFVCHNPASASDSPSVLNVDNCENVDIMWFPDRDASGADDADGQTVLYTCPVVAATSLDTDAERRLACQPMNGGTGNTLTATVTEIYGVGGVRIWADVTLASTKNQLLVRCSQPSGGR